ncbi:MAG: metal ABC transporter substrate-binding protein, partial [Actinomycetota bacterium]
DEPAGDEDDETDGDEDDGSGAEADEASAEATAVGEGVSAVAPVFPLSWVAEQVAPAADVHLLTDQGEDPHDIELSPRGRERLETSDILLYMGDIDFQPQVETAAEAAQGETVSFADVVGEGTLRQWGDDEDDDHAHDDGDDDHAHDDEEEDDHAHDDDGDGSTYDPHAWFDPAAMAVVTEEIGEAFAATDPEDAEDYRANAATLAEEFLALDERMAETLGGSCEHDYVVVSHEAYAYLLEPFGYDQQGVSGAGGHGPASPQRIAELVDMIEEDGIEYVLTEPLEGREDAEAVAREAGDVELLEVYSFGVVDDAQLFEEEGFMSLLREQIDVTATALGCE